MSFFQDLKRRNVFRVDLAYVLGAWVLLQIIDFALEVIGAPDWILQELGWPAQCQPLPGDDFVCQ